MRRVRCRGGEATWPVPRSAQREGESWRRNRCVWLLAPLRQGFVGHPSLPSLRAVSEGWTRSQSIRTSVRFPFSVDLVEVEPPPTYQRIAAEASRLRQLGLPDSKIAAALGVTDKTVAKAIRWFSEIPRTP